jgi:hypothetical protein
MSSPRPEPSEARIDFPFLMMDLAVPEDSFARGD